MLISSVLISASQGHLATQDLCVSLQGETTLIGHFCKTLPVELLALTVASTRALFA
jgi:hypothetical protein